jgi:ubiquinone/menaquinone biosynthesis C-methylase UbiE
MNLREEMGGPGFVGEPSEDLDGCAADAVATSSRHHRELRNLPAAVAHADQAQAHGVASGLDQERKSFRLQPVRIEIGVRTGPAVELEQIVGEQLTELVPFLGRRFSQRHVHRTTVARLAGDMNRFVSTYDDVADAYSRALDPDGEGLVDPVLRELIADVAGQNVLSLACGQGQDARLLAGLGATVTGVDASGEMLRHARAQEAAHPRGIDYVQGDVRDLASFADAGFDGVVCHMALMDVPELQPTIQSVGRVLRDEGWFVFSIVHPCYHPHVEIVADYLADHRYLKQRPPDWLPPHAYHRPLAAYVNELAQAGFRIERAVEAHLGNRPADAGGVPGLLYLRAVKAPPR